MFVNPRTVSFFLSLAIAGLTLAFLSLFKEVPGQALLVTFCISFSAAFILIYLTLEFLVFKEINNIYNALERFKDDDFDISIRDLQSTMNPLKKVNEEIFNYASKKQQQIDELRRLENFRKEFIADISHELKTPIFAAQGFIHTLLDGAMYDKQVRDKFLKKSAKSLDGLQNLVEHLLTLSQLETGQIKMKFEDFDLYAVTQDIFDQLEPKAKKKNMNLEFSDSTISPCPVLGDKFRLTHVMSNLLENAIKYGNEGGVITVDLGDDKNNVMITVKDDGPGIPPEHLKRIFERFYRLDKSRSKVGGGSGLGLAIVKQTLEAHNSNVMVTSKINKGTAFTFKLKKGNQHAKIPEPDYL